MRIAPALLLVLVPGCGGVCEPKIEPPRARAQGAPLVVIREAQCRIAPVPEIDVARTLPSGATVQTVWATEGFYYVQAAEGVPCWVDSASVAPQQASGSRGLPLLLTPILMAVGEYVVKGTQEWLAGGASNPACGIVQVLREEGGRALVRTTSGTTGWIASAALGALSSVEAPDTSGTVAALQEGGALPPRDAGGLTVEVKLLRPDGRPIAADEILHFHEEYDVAVRCSRDCYVRMTAEQPHNEAVCQYHPNHLENFERSLRLPGGQWVNDEFLPPGRNFMVDEPIGEFDIIRVEANTSSPYTYVRGGDKGEGCQANSAFQDGALTGCSRGGGFSGGPTCAEAASRGLVMQPQAMSVAQVRLRTTREPLPAP